MDVNLLFDRDEGKGSKGEDVFLIKGSSGCWEEFVGIYFILFTFAFTIHFLARLVKLFPKSVPTTSVIGRP